MTISNNIYDVYVKYKERNAIALLVITIRARYNN